MEEQTTTTVRLYVGGLGEKVTEDDIKNTFSKLGILQSIDFIRTKARSFAYINFFPSSQTSLHKLFSTYNGCSWKGGKLKLEKAKEHYTDRLKREWAEEAELKNSEHTSEGEVDVSIANSSDPAVDLKDMELWLYFPKLRKVKPLPLSGTGKHKYSFRRLEAPPHPVHFCDCPEHSVLVRTRTVTRANDSNVRKGRIDKKEYNATNSVMNRFVSREKNQKEDKVHDSVIQDCGMNDEEISMMDSVMSKLLGKGTSKNNRDNLHTSQERTVQTSEIQDETIQTNDIDDETDDDDIQINTVARPDVSSFSSRSLEQQLSLPHDETNDIDDETDDDDDDEDDIQINAVGGRSKRQTSLANKMASLNERRDHDDLAHQKKSDFLDQNAESLKRKRKSVSVDVNPDDLASSILEKKGHPRIQEKDSEEHTANPEPESEPEPEPKRLKTNGMWSQKSAWKQLVGDGSSSSFTLSQITPGNDAKREKKTKLGKKASLNIKKGKKTVSFALETPIDSKEDEEVDKSVQIDVQSSQHDKKGKKVHRVAPEATPSDETPTGKEEDVGVNNSVQMSQSVQHDDKDEPPVAQSARGSSWLQRSSWTQLVGGGHDSSFSISQILPGDLLRGQKSEKPDEFGTFSTLSSGSFFKEPRTTETDSDVSEPSLDVSKKDAQEAIAPRDIEMSEASDSKPKKTSPIVRRGVEISDSCPFMRNADSVKDWMTAKTAMSNSLKKMKNK